MRGIYTTKRKGGAAVYSDYQPPEGRRVREKIELVTDGPNMAKRLSEARKRAAKELVRRQAAIAEGRYESMVQRRQAPTFAEYVQESYIPAMKLGTNSSRERMKERPLQREIYRCTEGTLAWFADYRLDKIDKDLVQRFILYRQESGANGPGINRDLARLRNLLNDAADNGLELRHVPWRKLTQQEKPVSFRAMLDHEEEPIFEGLENRIVRAFAETLLHTGIRPEACLRLRLGDHVDLGLGSIWIDEELDKIGRGYRVYINSHLLPLLRGLVAWRPEHLQRDGVELFCHGNGKPRQRAVDAWQVACDRAGVEWRGKRGLKLRSLRPTFKTRIVKAGGAEIDAERLLGHSTRSLADRYYDPDEEHLRKVIELTILRPPNVLPLRVQSRRGDSFEAARR